MPPHNISILVVDDFPTLRRIVINILKQLGYHNVTEAADGMAALEHLRNNSSTDLIICDWYMPEMTGLDLLKSVRNDKEFKNIASFFFRSAIVLFHVVKHFSILQ